MAFMSPTRSSDGRPARPAEPSSRFRPNALRNAQVLPPHSVDLTLSPTTLEQIRAPLPHTEAKEHETGKVGRRADQGALGAHASP
jgi:hypothetical protein